MLFGSDVDSRIVSPTREDDEITGNWFANVPPPWSFNLLDERMTPFMTGFRKFVSRTTQSPRKDPVRNWTSAAETQITRGDPIRRTLIL